MTLLFFDGLQDAILVPKPEWASGTTWAAILAGRDGSTNGAANLGTNGTRTLNLPTPAATCIAACGVRETSFATNNWVVAFRDSAGTVQLVVIINASGFIEVRRTSGAGTLLGTSTGHTAIALSTWNHIAVKAVLGTGTNGSFTVQLNGVTVLTVTGATTSSLDSSVYSLQYAGGVSATIAWDDIYVADAVDATGTQGRTNNDFLGDLKVQTLVPTSDGDTTQFTPSTGTNHSALVAEVPPNTTDFNSDNVSGHRDLYNVTDLLNASVVYGVRESLYAAKTDAGSALIKPCLKENSVVTSESSQALTPTFGVVCGALRFVRPSDSAVWTVTDVNNLQVGAEIG